MEGRYYWFPGSDREANGSVPSYFLYRDIFTNSDIAAVLGWVQRPARKGKKKYGLWAPRFDVFDMNERDKVYTVAGYCVARGGFRVIYRKSRENEKREMKSVNENPFQGDAVYYSYKELPGPEMSAEEISYHQERFIDAMRYWNSHIVPETSEDLPEYDDIMERYIESFVRAIKNNNNLSPLEKGYFMEYFKKNVPDYEKFYRNAFNEREFMIWRIK